MASHPPPPPPQLRAEAEARLAGARPATAPDRSSEELVHELRVHQVELEMQNEALLQSQIALEESHERYVDLYEFAPVGYLTLGAGGLIVKMNLTAASLLGTERGKLVNRRFSTVVAAEDRNRFNTLLVSAIGSNDRQSFDLLLQRGDGSVFPAHLDFLRVATQDKDAAPEQRVALSDISELKRAEDALHRLNQTLEASNRELEAFSYSISHDLRTPLRALSGFSDALLEDYADRLDTDGLDYLRRIHAASERMGRLIDDLMDLARIGQQDLHRVEVRLDVLAAEILAEHHEQEPQRDVSWSIAPGLSVHADRVLMQVLLGNLLGNAWKFTAERADARIEFGRIRLDREEAFYVRDNGAGFSMDFADKLFKPFHHLHHVERFAGTGTGIGLAIVQRIVQRHGGRIWAEGVPNQGATFWFTL